MLKKNLFLSLIVATLCLTLGGGAKAESIRLYPALMANPTARALFETNIFDPWSDSSKIQQISTDIVTIDQIQQILDCPVLLKVIFLVIN
jgi:hypothetical protein